MSIILRARCPRSPRLEPAAGCRRHPGGACSAHVCRQRPRRLRVGCSGVRVLQCCPHRPCAGVFLGSPYGVTGDRPSRPDPATTDGEVGAVSPFLPLFVAVRPLAHAVLCGPLAGSIQYARPYLHHLRRKSCLRPVTVPLAGCNRTLVSSPHPSNASASSSSASSCFSSRTLAPCPHLPPLHGAGVHPAPVCCPPCKLSSAPCPRCYDTPLWHPVWTWTLPAARSLQQHALGVDGPFLVTCTTRW